MTTSVYKSPSPSISKALDFIRLTLSEVPATPETRLPSLAQLAAHAGVSRSSMWKGLVLAKSMKLVTVTAGGYITAGNDTGRSMRIDGTRHGIDKGRIWKTTQKRLARDILDGHYDEHGRLPSTKELRNIYGVCAPTLKKILFSLAENGLVVPYRKIWQLPRIAIHENSRNTIIMLSEGIAENEVTIYNERLQKLIGTLENLSAQSGMQTALVNLNATDSRMLARVHSALKNTKNILGCILNVPWTIDEKVLGRAGEIVEAIASRRIPIAVFDTLGTFSLPRRIAPLTHVRIFRSAAFRAGVQVANHLLAQGHKRIAYVSLNHNHQWSLERLAGLIDQFAAVGLAGGVIPFVMDTMESQFGSRFWFGDLPQKKITKILSVRSNGRTPYGVPLLNDPVNDKHARDPQFKPFRSSLKAVGALIDKNVEADLFEQLRDMALGWAFLKGSRVLIEPLLAKALSDKSITAWVCANDGTSISARLFLTGRGIKIPDEISVIGFDNRSDSLDNRLSTYDFNVSGILHRMIWFIRQPAIRPAREPGPEEVEGMIIERGSTGRVTQRQ